MLIEVPIKYRSSGRYLEIYEKQREQDAPEQVFLKGAIAASEERQIVIPPEITSLKPRW